MTLFSPYASNIILIVISRCFYCCLNINNLDDNENSHILY